MSEDMEMGATPPEESGNRMFLIGAIILGSVFVIALIAIFALYFLTRGSQPAVSQPQDLTATAAFQAGATQTGDAQATQTRVAQALQTAAITYTPSLTLTTTKSLTMTPTPVVFATIAQGTITPTETGEPTGMVKATSTNTKIGATAVRVTATRTQVGAATALPKTGFGDSGGFPALLILGGVSLAVIVLARQLRLARVRH